MFKTGDLVVFKPVQFLHKNLHGYPKDGEIGIVEFADECTSYVRVIFGKQSFILTFLDIELYDTSSESQNFANIFYSLKRQVKVAEENYQKLLDKYNDTIKTLKEYHEVCKNYDSVVIPRTVVEEKAGLSQSTGSSPKTAAESFFYERFQRVD